MLIVTWLCLKALPLLLKSNSMRFCLLGMRLLGTHTQGGEVHLSKTALLAFVRQHACPVIRMTKRRFQFVVGKFTAVTATAHQIAFVEAFERMEV